MTSPLKEAGATREKKLCFPWLCSLVVVNVHSIGSGLQEAMSDGGGFGVRTSEQSIEEAAS